MIHFKPLLIRTVKAAEIFADVILITVQPEAGVEETYSPKCQNHTKSSEIRYFLRVVCGRQYRGQSNDL